MTITYFAALVLLLIVLAAIIGLAFTIMDLEQRRNAEADETDVGAPEGVFPGPVFHLKQDRGDAK